MYLTLLTCDTSSFMGRSWLANPYRVHQRLLMAFPDGDAGRMLYRIEDGWQPPRILVQAPGQADWARAFADLPVLAETPQQKTLEITPATGQRLRFRLRANPTKRVGADQENDKLAGKRVQLFGEEAQVAWLRRQGERGGFALLDCRVSGVETQRSRRTAGAEMRHQAVTFDGVLRVTDAVAFLDALAGGIGPAKGFGCGLLSVARS